MKENKIKDNKYLAKRTKGITLVALVVTVTILLILAGVSITVVFGDNGLINYSKDSASRTNSTIDQTKNKIGDINNELYDFMHPSEQPSTQAPTPTPTQAQTPNPTPTPTPTPKSKNAIAKEYGIIQEQNKPITEGDKTLTIPAGFMVVNPEKDTTVKYEDNDNPQIDEGIVIQDETGNQFVWVPIFKDRTIYIISGFNNYGQLYDFGDSSQPNIPAKGISTYAGRGNREPDILGDIDYKDQYMDILGLDSKNDFLTQLKNEFKAFADSVNQYNGFYIGRYETGNLVDDKENTPVVQKGRKDINNVNWYYQYQTSKNIASKNTDKRVQGSVTSGMIWGCQWDAVMNWFLKGTSEEKKYVTDSTGWYKDITGDNQEKNSDHLTGVDLIKDGKIVNRVKNIYDMGGNVQEWTMEADLTKK